jgi:hypothetical protein
VKDMSVVLLWRGSVTSDGQRSEEDTEATSRSYVVRRDGSCGTSGSISTLAR